MKVKITIKFNGMYQWKNELHKEDLMQGSLDQLEIRLKEQIRNHFPKVDVIEIKAAWEV